MTTPSRQFGAATGPTGPTEPPRCPVCGNAGQLVEASYGPRWTCAPCDTSVGCHPRTTTPLGTMATKPQRSARMAAHTAFDPLWEYKLVRNPRMSKSAARRAAYAWLAGELGLHIDDCHIALFDVPQCMRVVEVCATAWQHVHRHREALALQRLDTLTDPASPLPRKPEP